jgi:hypothetical protein
MLGQVCVNLLLPERAISARQYAEERTVLITCLSRPLLLGFTDTGPNVRVSLCVHGKREERPIPHAQAGDDAGDRAPAFVLRG